MAGWILVNKNGFFEMSFGRNYKQKCGRYRKTNQRVGYRV